MKAKKKKKQVALAFPIELPHIARTLQGIIAYGQQHGEWQFSFNPEGSNTSLLGLKGWPGDGIIAQVTTQREVRAAGTLGVPVVNLSGSLANTGLPRVTYDQEAIGRMAAEHLLASAFHRFAYYGELRAWYSQLRRRGFVERVKQEGHECSALEAPSCFGTRWSSSSWVEPLEQWLRSLDCPVGLMAVFDLRASVVVDACRRLGLHVPQDVAVIGVHNHAIICELCQVPLSSVLSDDYRLGYEAAALLGRLMAGKQPPKRDIIVPPQRVVRRDSTNVTAVDDPTLAKVVAFIRDHLDEPFGIEKLMHLVPHSRRWLTTRFKQCLGVPPYEFICQIRVERAKELLAGPEKLQMQQICDACGFNEPRRFRAVFERLTGVTPAAYRRTHQRCD